MRSREGMIRDITSYDAWQTSVATRPFDQFSGSVLQYATPLHARHRHSRTAWCTRSADSANASGRRASTQAGPEEVNFGITQRYTSGARALQETSQSSGQSSHLGSNRRRCRYRIKRGSILGWVRRTSFYRTLWRS